MVRAGMLIAALSLAAGAFGDLVTLKDGRVLEGKILGEASDRIILQMSARVRMPILRAQIHSIERSPFVVPKAPAPKAPTPAPKADAPKPRTDAPAETQKTVYVLQIVGPIESDVLVMEVADALNAATSRKADVLLIELDTPGGRLDYTTKICGMIEKAEKLGLQPIAWVRMGKSRGAYSAGAIIAMACQRIYMAPGTAIGSATPFRMNITGSAEVDEKMTSATSAMARGLAESHGHPPDLAAAMVDRDIEVHEVVVDGKPQLVSAERAKELCKQGAKPGKVISKEGKLVALTAEEACRVGFAAGQASTRDEVLAALGVAGARIVGTKSGEAIAKRAAERDGKLQKLEAAIAAGTTKAKAADPGATVHKVWEGSGTFLDHGRLWRQKSDEALRAWTLVLKLYREKLQAAEQYPGLEINQEAVKAAMVEIKLYCDKLKAERNRKGL